jgi:hypothetical protein
MAQARSAATVLSVPRVQVIAPTRLGETAVAALRVRGIDARAAAHPDIGDDDVVAWAVEHWPTASSAVELARTCERAALNGRPVCLLAPQPRGTGRATVERAAALAYLRAHGAALGHDVDAWLEAVVALVRYGMPHGRRTAFIAPPGSWLEAQASALSAEAEAAGERPIAIGRAAKSDEATDVLLYDPVLGAPPTQLPGLHVPVVPRGEIADDVHAVYGARSAYAAIEMLGRAAERIAVGTGAAPAAASAELEVDRGLLDRQLGKLVAEMRVGDHETKVLLRAYGVAITRQVVATTPSAAVKKARDVGFPVELKPWGHDVPTERDGCPIERDVTSDALVRRAFAAVLGAAGRLPAKTEPAAVIVRQAPPLGRDLGVSIVKLPALGWTVVVDANGQLAAAPAPLRLHDASELAAAFAATRAGDPEPDRAGLANILRRASHLAVELDDRLELLELPRVVVGGRGSRSVVADAWCKLR